MGLTPTNIVTKEPSRVAGGAQGSPTVDQQKPPVVQEPLGPTAVIAEAQSPNEIQFLRLRGIRLVDRNSDGIDWSDVLDQLDTDRNGNLSFEEIGAAALSQTLFNLIDQGMLVGDDRRHDGVLTREEIAYAMSVIQRYAGIIHMEASTVLASYNGATSFANRDLNVLQTTQGEIIAELTRRLSSGTITSDQVRTALEEMSYDPQVIEAVMLLIQDMTNLTAELVASCIMRVVEAARNGHTIYDVDVSRLPAFPTEEDISPAVIQGWLRGQAPVDDNIFFTDPDIRESFLELFDYQHRSNPSQQREAAQRFVLYLLSRTDLGERRIALAERAVEIFAGEHALELSPANRRHYLPYLEGQADWTISGVNGSDEVNAQLANAYIGLPYITPSQVEQALTHVRLLSNAEQKGRLAQQLVQICLNTNGRGHEQVVMLDLAFSIAREFEQIPERLEILRQIAEVYHHSTAVRTEGSPVRATAIEVLRVIQETDPDRTFNIQGREGGPATAGALIAEYSEEQLESVSVYAIRQRVFPRGSDPEFIETSEIPGALRDLQAILDETSEMEGWDTAQLRNEDPAARERFAERACAEQLMAEIISKRAQQLPADCMPLAEGNSEEIMRSTGYQLHELAAYLARRAYLDLAALAEAIGEIPRAPQQPAYGYTRRAREVNGITPRTVFRLAPLWQTRGEGNRGQAIRNRTEVRTAFRHLLGYVPNGSLVPNMYAQQTRNAAEDPYQLSVYVKNSLVVERDDVEYDQPEADARLLTLTGEDNSVNPLGDGNAANNISFYDRYLDIVPAGGRAPANPPAAPPAPVRAPHRDGQPARPNRAEALTAVQGINAAAFTGSSPISIATARERIQALRTAANNTPSNQESAAINSAEEAIRVQERRERALAAVREIPENINNVRVSVGALGRIRELENAWRDATQPPEVTAAISTARQSITDHDAQIAREASSMRRAAVGQNLGSNEPSKIPARPATPVISNPAPTPAHQPPAAPAQPPVVTPVPGAPPPPPSAVIPAYRRQR